MVINGASRRNVRFWARHLLDTCENESAEVVKIHGLRARTLGDALWEMEAQARGTRCENFMWCADLNPRGDERLTEEGWERARAILERHRRYEGQPHVVIEHRKDNRVHRHVVWSRIDTTKARALPDGLDARVCHAAARDIERALGLIRTISPLDKNRPGPRPKRAPKSWEMHRGRKSGIDPRAVKAEVTALFRASENGRDLQAALEQRGYRLVRGDRRGFCILDRAGHEHSLARRLDGVTTRQLTAFMRDVDRAFLPSVAEARAQHRRAKGPGTGSRLNREAREAPRLKARKGGQNRRSPANSAAARMFRRAVRGTVHPMPRRGGHSVPAPSVKKGVQAHPPPRRRSLAEPFSVLARSAPKQSAPPPLIRAVVQTAADKRNAPSRPFRYSRSGPMSKGELYEYYKRIGCLEQFFGMFPEP